MIFLFIYCTVHTHLQESHEWFASSLHHPHTELFLRAWPSPRSVTVGSGSFMSPPPCNGTTFFRRCLLGAFLSKIFTKIKVLDGTLRYCVARSQRPTTRSILRPCRSQFYIQFDLHYTSNSTSIIHPIRSQLYVQFDLNYTSNSTSILRPIRPQLYVQFDLNYTSNSTSILRPIRDYSTEFHKLVRTDTTTITSR